MFKLDQIDLAILAALQADGRITNVALARQVGLSATPCLERVKALESAGLIAGYVARLSAPALGLGLTVFVQISLDRTSAQAFADFREAVQGIPEIQECHMVAGGFDYLLKVRVPDMTSYRNFLGAVLSGIPGIRETHSYPVMEEVKDSATLSLRHLQGGQA
ncbi:Lrp/AsnC ligand binding domain-containing protein [Azonexus sp. IMCC34839]|uniref:Lrp/AsnC ligand binding domain-containing protein n=1 Tax=Azonexus sp. IMCC34839 TaxID=3133695 RepID=UPI00399BCDF5